MVLAAAGSGQPLAIPINEPTLDALERETFSAVQRAAAQAGPVRLLGATLHDRLLTLDFSRELLALEPDHVDFERFSRAIHVAAADVLRTALPSFEVATRIEGVPLSQFLRPPLPALPLAPRLSLPPPRAALANRRIAVSPGHGYYLNGSTYVLQRSFWSGIVEDFVNHDIVTQLNAALVEAGAQVIPTRNLDRNAGVGETGFPKWQEAARYHVKAVGADPSVWNEAGFTHLEQDIRCRPRYANAVNADILVSIHNNGAPTPGTATGTETLYDTGNGYAAESKRLADILHAKVITAIRRDYDPNWVDRRVQGFNGNYGENRLATRPAVLMELAFMDRPSPDNAALQNETFKRLVAQALRDGIREYFDGPAPATPDGLIASSTATSIALTWTDRSSNEDGFVVERRTGTSGAWSTIATLPANTRSYTDNAVAAATIYHFRVRAFNAGGDSPQFSNEVTAETSAPRPVLAFIRVTPAATQTYDWGQEVAFTLAVGDSGGRPIAGAGLAGQDDLRNVALDPLTAVTDANGEFVYRSLVPAGQANGTYTFTFTAAKDGFGSSATLTRQAVVSHASAAAGTPTIRVQPAAQSVTAGTTAEFRVTAEGAAPLAYQWQRDGAPLPGATSPILVVASASPAQAGRYAITITNTAGAVTSLAAPLSVHPATWLANVSLRTSLVAGQPVIVGFVVAGGPKEILLRAAGPTLAQFGLPTAMADPRLDLYRGATKVAENNDWPSALAPTIAALGAFPFAAASRDAALLGTLTGPHTVQATGTTAGLVLIEGYDAGRGSATRLVNLSARNRVGTGADLLIAGFFVGGTGSQRVLIRAAGPALAPLGVSGALADPKLEVFEATGSRLAENDNWEPALATIFGAVGAFPFAAGSRDSAVLITLSAGRGYTAQVSGVSGGTGEALIEVYEVP